MAGVTRKLWKQLQRLAASMPRAKTTCGFGAWECVWWLSVHSYAGEAPCSQVLHPVYSLALYCGNWSTPTEVEQLESAPFFEVQDVCGA